MILKYTIFDYMYFERTIYKRLIEGIKPNKVTLLLGARRIGKTMLLKQVNSQLPESALFLNAEEQMSVQFLQQRSSEYYRNFLGNTKYLIIDEAQKIENIGSILKLMVDQIEGLHIIVTGSSMFDLTEKLGEPLTGRKTSYFLYPLAQSEFSKYENAIQTRERLSERLVFGSYPELQQYTSIAEKTEYLQDLTYSYLLKDILMYEQVRNSSKLFDLLRLLAYQVGKEVSYQELGTQLGMGKNTVERYLDLLSKVFIIYKLPGFSRNLRSEVTKSSKWYFYDNGIRNTLIANLNPVSARVDVGDLWENYILSERIKKQKYNGMLVNNFFWRTYAQQEIDWVEEREGNLFAYEIKWNANKRVKTPPEWCKTYPESVFEVITPENYLSFIV